MRVRRKDGTLTSAGYAKLNFRHGEKAGRRTTPEYQAFQNAKRRCDDDPYYAGRGIKFLFTSFEQFLFEIGRRPSRKHVLDRNNNDGHYESGNVHWATRSESNKNRRMTPKRKKSLLRNLKKVFRSQ